MAAVRPELLVSDYDFERLRVLVDMNAEGRDADAAELLEDELDRATIVPTTEMPADVVTMNSRVVFEHQNTGARREVTLVYPSQASPSAGRISVMAPIGVALLGLSVGQHIEWPMPGGRTARLRILSVLPQEEAVAAV